NPRIRVSFVFSRSDQETLHPAGLSHTSFWATYGKPAVTDWLDAKLSWEEAARLQYRIRPYLSAAPRSALDARLSDIAVNLFDFMPDGGVGLWDNPFR